MSTFLHGQLEIFGAFVQHPLSSHLGTALIMLRSGTPFFFVDSSLPGITSLSDVISTGGWFVVFSEQAYAGGNTEHSTHRFPEALLRSKLCEQADDQLGAGSLSRPGGGKEKYFMAVRRHPRHPPCFYVQGCWGGSCMLLQCHGSPDVLDSRSMPHVFGRVWASFTSEAVPGGYWQRIWTRHLIMSLFCTLNWKIFFWIISFISFFVLCKTVF